MTKSLAFPKTSRIHLKKDFEFLKEQSRKVFAPPLVLYSKNSRLNYSHARLGLSVSSKRGNAVKRNRLKRILREEFRRSEVAKSLPLDLLFVVSQKVTDEGVLRATFHQLLKKVSEKR